MVVVKELPVFICRKLKHGVFGFLLQVGEDLETLGWLQAGEGQEAVHGLVSLLHDNRSS
jgi:hypothetical protein